MKLGDVVRVLELHEAKTFEYHDLPVWGVVVSTQASGLKLLKIVVGEHHLVTTGWRDKSDPEKQLLVQPDSDTLVLAPPDQWPDEVCAAVALYKLTGEVS